MKRFYWRGVVLLCLLSLTGGASVLAATFPLGELARRELGAPTVAILSHATRVQAFRLNTAYDPLDDRVPAPRGPAFDGFEITAAGQEQGPSFAHRLASVLFNDRTYEGLETKCILVPSVGFRAWRERDSVDVLICFHCADLEVRVQDASGKETSRTRVHFGLMQPIMLALAREAFPTDAALRALTPSVDDRGFSLLIAAALKGHSDLVQALLNRGLNVRAKDLFGRTDMGEACVFGFDQIAYRLVERGADVNDADALGNTALMWAVSRNNLPLTRFLLEHGADVNQKNNEGETVLDFHLGGRNREMEALLKAHDGKSGLRRMPHR